MRVLYFYLMKDAADRVRTVAPEHAAYWQGLRLPEYLGGPRRCGSGVRSSSTPWWWTAVRLRWKTTSSKIEPCWATRNLRIEFSTPTGSPVKHAAYLHGTNGLSVRSSHALAGSPCAGFSNCPPSETAPERRSSTPSGVRRCSIHRGTIGQPAAPMISTCLDQINRPSA